MFASDYLKNPANADVTDWQCVYDLCATCRLTYWKIDLTADWSPSKRVVAFGNSWEGVPDMFSQAEPTEEEIEFWVSQHDEASPYLRARKAAKLRRLAFEERLESMAKRLAKEGMNYVVLAYDREKPKLLIRTVGLMTKMDVFRSLSAETKKLGILYIHVGKQRDSVTEHRRIQRKVIERYGRGCTVLPHYDVDGALGDEIKDYTDLFMESQHGIVTIKPDKISSKIPDAIVWPKDVDWLLDGAMAKYVNCDANGRHQLDRIVFNWLYKCIEGVAIDHMCKVSDKRCKRCKDKLQCDDCHRVSDLVNSWFSAGLTAYLKKHPGCESYNAMHLDLVQLARDLTDRKLDQYRPKNVSTVS